MTITNLLAPIPDDVRNEVNADAALILVEALCLRETPPDDLRPAWDEHTDDEGWDR